MICIWGILVVVSSQRPAVIIEIFFWFLSAQRYNLDCDHLRGVWISLSIALWHIELLNLCSWRLTKFSLRAAHMALGPHSQDELIVDKGAVAPWQKCVMASKTIYFSISQNLCTHFSCLMECYTVDNARLVLGTLATCIHTLQPVFCWEFLRQRLSENKIQLVIA